MGFKYLWISAPELQSWTTICCRRQEGPWNGCVGQAWFMIRCSLKPSPFRAWVLFDFSGLCLLREWKKERKKKYRERDRIWEKMKERKKKNVVKLKRKKHLPLKTKTFLPYSGVAVERRTKFLKQVLSVTQQFLEKKMLSSCGYMVKKEPYNKFFIFYFGKGLHITQWITFWLLGCLLQTII